ncbi:MAG: glycogen synthase GlgA [Candidatus Aegiribacteria sp.]|nr:glycogen synthase GlgA [Candidatus Aegiribacteria sp.]
MKILFVTAEAYPFASTGGLAGVTGSLPVALERIGHTVSLIMPFYRDIKNLDNYDWIGDQFLTSAGEKFGLAQTVLPGSNVSVYLISKDEYFDRPGIYGPDDASAYQDNAGRFSFFSRAIASFQENLKETPDILHCHDWQTGLVPAYIRSFRKPAVVFTVHNMRYQGNYPPEEFSFTFLPWSLFTIDGLEYFGTFSFLKSGIVFSDQITTVSTSYAKEIQTPAFGESMDGIFRKRSGSLTGILNGIDYEIWNPSTDPAIEASYSANAIGPRKICRNELIRQHNLERNPDGMIVGIVSRLTEQKGLDLLFPIVGKLIQEGLNFVILGTGEKRYMEKFKELSKKNPGRISVTLDYDEEMARSIFAGCDLFIMPSRFEPCGLAQMMAMRYGAVPLVRKTGGLADTVIDERDNGFGFVFDNADPDELLRTVLRARGLFGNRRKWTWLVKRCMKQDNSWSSRAEQYVKVYRKAVETRRRR